MISKIENEILSFLLNSPEIDENKYFNELKQLLNDELIEHNVTGTDRAHIYYHGYIVTPKGKRAYEEYSASLEEENRNKEAVELAKESNVIATTANELSNEANKISKKSNRLSIWAIIISVAAVIIAICDIAINVCI